MAGVAIGAAGWVMEVAGNHGQCIREKQDQTTAVTRGTRVSKLQAPDEVKLKMS